MTPIELAQLRDRVARKRLKGSGRVKPGNLRNWSPERMDAADSALAALRKAERRSGKNRPLRQERCVYCGADTRPRRRPYWVPATCVKHRDLPRLDPFYVERAA